MLYHNQSLEGNDSCDVTLNTACFLTFKRLQRAVNRNMVGAVVWLCMFSIYFLHFVVATTYTSLICNFYEGF